MRKKIVIFLAFIAIAWGLAAGIKSGKNDNVNIENNIENQIEENYIDELNLPLIEVDTLNPLRTTNMQVANILNLIYEPLINFKSDESLEGILLEEWAKLDSNTWIIKLKKNILWHNGNKLTANDVIFTFNTLINNELIYSKNLSNVKEIIKLDDYSIKIILENKDDYFISKLNFPIISESYFKVSFENEEKSNKPIGTGPYKYVNTNKEGIINLEFNSSWHKESKAKLQKIKLYKYASYGEAIKAFKSAKVDMIVTNMSNWQDKFGTIGLNSYSFENSEYEVLIPNCNNIILSENSVRRAILQGINRANIINSVYKENAAISDIPIHTNSKNSITNTEYNLEKAKQILINAGWAQNENGWQKKINEKIRTLNFNILVNKESEEKLQVAEKIKNDLEEIGIKINIKKVSKENILTAIVEDNFELILASIDVKNEFFINEQITQMSELNYSNYMSNQMQKVLQEISASEESYNENIHTLTQLYKNDAPYIGLYFKTSTILTNKSVKGKFEPTWSNYYRNITSFCK